MEGDKVRVLRKLEEGEVITSRMSMAPNTIRTMRVRTRTDLFAHLVELKSAVHAWKRSQPLLQAKVVPKDDDFYFVIDENSSANRLLENVHFLRVESRVDEAFTRTLVDEDVLVDLVIEKCGDELIDIEKPHELLWQLQIIEMKRDKDEYVYEFVWHITHMIADGMSMSKNFIRLLDLIHRSINSKPIEPIDYGMYTGTRTIFAKEYESIPDTPSEPPYLANPEFLDPETARRHSRAHYDPYFAQKTPSQLEIDLVDASTGKCFVRLDELIRIANEKSNLKRAKFEVPAEVFSKFYKKCKMENTKVTSALNVLSAFTIFELYKTRGYKLDKCYDFVAVSLRQLRPPNEIGPMQLANCVGALITVIPNTDEEENGIGSRFWPLAREQSASLDARVHTDLTKFFRPRTFSLSDVNGMLFHVSVSNIGVVDLDSYECFSPTGFAIDNMFTTVNISHSLDKILTGLFFCTLGNKLYGSLGYNSFYFDPKAAREFTLRFPKLLESVCE